MIVIVPLAALLMLGAKSFIASGLKAVAQYC
jgi:hypothetical protein